MAFPEPIPYESCERLYRQAMLFYNRYEEAKRLLADMLHQHGDNCALSVNEDACKFLGHPQTTEPYDGTRCYCRERKYKNKPSVARGGE